MNSSKTSTTTHEWLPMPSGISLSPHNSFSRDLLRQFDKRRSQLNFDSISIHKDESDHASNKSSQHTRKSSNHNQLVASLILDTTSLSSSSISIENTDDLQQKQERGSIIDNDIVQYDSTTNENTTARRSKSAGNLLRKSSVYLRNKFNQHHHLSTIEQQTNTNIPRNSTTTTLFNSIKKKKKNRRSAQDIFNNANINQPQQQQTPHLSKIAINTTINIGSIGNNHLIDLNNSHHIIQPPIITQYPPKPLKYSPVEPLPDEYQYAGNNDNTVINSNSYNSKRRKTLHRLSLPLLKLTAASQSQGEEREIYRRRSDSDLLNEQSISTTNHNLLHSIGKQWNKLIFTCKNRGASKKKKVTL